jgi:hypothetical protein
LPCPVTVAHPDPRRPGNPNANAKLIHAVTVATPSACCYVPRAVKIIAVRAVANARTVALRSATGTPVVRSVRSGQSERTARRTASNPVVRAATYCSSTSPSPIAMQQPVGQGQVGARHRPQMPLGQLRGRARPRIDHNVFSAALAAGLKPLHRRRHRVRRVAPDQQHHIRVGHIAERER